MSDYGPVDDVLKNFTPVGWYAYLPEPSRWKRFKARLLRRDPGTVIHGSL